MTAVNGPWVDFFIILIYTDRLASLSWKIQTLACVTRYKFWEQTHAHDRMLLNQRLLDTPIKCKPFVFRADLTQVYPRKSIAKCNKT